MKRNFLVPVALGLGHRTVAQDRRFRAQPEIASNANQHDKHGCQAAPENDVANTETGNGCLEWLIWVHGVSPGMLRVLRCRLWFVGLVAQLL